MAAVAEPVTVESKEEVAVPASEPKNGAESAAPAAEESEKLEEESSGDLSKEERAIIRQVEYYFGDANLNRDKFLREQIGKGEEGWVPFSVLITFKRLAALSTDIDAIIDALNKSEEGLIQISEDKQSLRRHPERPLLEHNEERRKEIQERTAYAKGFPLESKMSELLEFFGSYNKVLNITMRKHFDKPTKSYKFKGSIFLTFETKDQAKAFLDVDKIVYKERELLRKWQLDYLKEKQDEYAEKNLKRKNKKEAAKEQLPAIELPKNAIVVFEGAPDTVTREDIRGAFEKVADFEIAYIEFNKGDTKGSVRLTEADAAEKYLAKVDDGKLKLNDEVSLTLRKATDEEEKEFLDKAVEFMQRRRDFTRNKSRGRFNNRKRHGGDNKYQGKKARKD